MNSHYQLTPEAEFRYIVTWFRDFSEYEKADFMTILIQWLLKNSEISVNGINDISDDSSMASDVGKPLSIFLCRVSFMFHQTPIGFHLKRLSFAGQAVQGVDAEMAGSAALAFDR